MCLSKCNVRRYSEAIVAANVSTMFQTNENVSSAVACAKLPVPDIVGLHTSWNPA
jgi:hypothetical protein